MIRFKQWDLHAKRVFLRADLNVPIEGGVIKDAARLEAIRSTLDALLDKGATVIMATHLGRPQGYDPELSTRPLAEWLQSHGYTCIFVPYEPTGFEVPTHRHEKGVVYLLDNLRFFRGEKRGDELFAHMLKSLADFYVNDAFGTIYNDDTSTTLLASLYNTEHKSAGHLIERELNALQPLTDNNVPLLTILGGCKEKEKIPLIGLLAKRPKVTIALTPALVFTFLKALNKPTGLSRVNDAMLETAQAILENHFQQLVLPQDYIVSELSLVGSLLEVEEIIANTYGITIGPKTVEQYCALAQISPHVFINSASGFIQRPETLVPMNALLRCAANAPGYRVAAGGDTIHLVNRLKLEHIFSFCSMGGGAALAVIAGAPLPALKALELS